MWCARRFELVDKDGRVRAVLGDVGAPDGYTPGLDLLDRLGNSRTTYALFRHGATLDFVVGGN